MGGSRLTVRIIGLAATIRGFAYAITEGPGCLVDVNTRRPGSEKDAVAEPLATILANSRPLFVALSAENQEYKRGTRERVLDDAVTAVCAEQEVMILRITQEQLSRLVGVPDATPFEVAEEVVRRFPDFAYSLPQKRQLWEQASNSLGAFQAVAVALAAWQKFRPPPIDGS